MTPEETKATPITKMNHDLYCPYCGAPNEVNHDDGQGYTEDEAHEMQCSSCYKNFVFRTSISYAYHPEKADCLNGEPHDFDVWRMLYVNVRSEEVQHRRCYNCDHTERRTVPNDTAHIQKGRERGPDSTQD